MTRVPLNKLFRRAVQCRDQPVVNRLIDHSHPNKVSMKKKEKGEEEAGGRHPYIPFPWGGGRFLQGGGFIHGGGRGPNHK